LHDRTADKIAAAVSRIPRSAATIVPYDVPSRVAVLQARGTGSKAVQAAKPVTATEPAAAGTAAMLDADGEQTLIREADVAAEHEFPADGKRGHGAAAGPRGGRPQVSGSMAAGGVTAIGAVTAPGKVAVEGRVRVVEIRPVERNSVLAVEINDSTGNLTAMFYGRSHIPGLICGARVRFNGRAGISNGQPVMINPAYELLFPGAE
jgi:hypothetical protein